MKRSMMQIYVKGSDKAVAFYQRAFGAELGLNFLNAEGTYDHAELDVFGQILAITESMDDKPRTPGDAMQFCLHFGEGNEDLVRRIYDVLTEDAMRIEYPLGPVDYSPLMASLVDKFGIYWCIFV